MSITIPNDTLKNIQVADYLKNGFEVYKNNFAILIAGFLISIGLTVLTLGILGGAMFAGYIRLCARLSKPEEGQEPPKATDVFDGFNVFLPALLLAVGTAVVSIVLNYILGLFGSVGSLVFALVDFVLIGAVASVAMPLIAFEKTTSALEAVTAAIDAVKAAPSQTSLLFIVSGLLGYVGIIALGIGIILTLPFTFCVNALLFNKLFRSEGTEEEVTLMQSNG
jgi:hypothetical protein